MDICQICETPRPQEAPQEEQPAPVAAAPDIKNVDELQKKKEARRLRYFSRRFDSHAETEQKNQIKEKQIVWEIEDKKRKLMFTKLSKQIKGFSASQEFLSLSQEEMAQ